MKFIVIALAATLCSSAFAMWTEVECSGQSSAGAVNLAVEEGFGPGSLRNAAVQLKTAEGGETKRFTVMSRGAFGNRVRYEAAGFDLEVDFWPDARPQWARTYRGNFTATDMNIPFTMLWCRFPNIRP